MTKWSSCTATLLRICPLLLVIMASPALAQQPGPGRIAFTNVTLVDGTGAPSQPGMTVVIHGTRIERVVRSDHISIGGDVRVVDGRGKYLIPGMIDTHAHFFVWLSPGAGDTAQAAARGAGVYIANGVTTLIDASARGSRDETTRRARAMLQAGGLPMPRIHLSARVDSLVVNRARAANATELARQLLAHDIVGIKIHRGLNADDLRGIVREARNAGRPVYGHTYEWTSTGYHDYTHDAIEAGVNGLFHVLGIAPVHPSREPAPPPEGAKWEDQWLYGATRWLHADSTSVDSLIRQMLVHRTWLQPTLVAEELTADVQSYWTDPAWRYAPPEQDSSLTGWPRFQGADLDNYRASYGRMKSFVRRFHEAGGMVVAGTDGIRIPGFGLQDELRLLAQAGLSPMAALQAATRNAARAFGLDRDLGTIEPGKLADVILLDADPLADIGNTRRILAVVSNGTYLDRNALDALLAAAERPIPGAIEHPAASLRRPSDRTTLQ
ncbi:MAG TPA: amidohydrolase family protein [Vicinamibacterales bacterium]|nr:amidohydrolase family protein [Vicinamibacterales bacterium]